MESFWKLQVPDFIFKPFFPYNHMSLKDLPERIRRVLLVSSKPDKEEFVQSAKITGLGIAVIGFIGFIIFLVVMLIGGL